MKPLITGVGAVPVRRQLERSARDTATAVALQAIGDAGLEPGEIDGLFVTPPGLSGPPGFMWSCAFAHHLGLTTKAQALVECGGMTAALALRSALDAVTLGRSRAALVVALDARVVDVPENPEDVMGFVENAVVGLVGLYGPYDALFGVGAPIPYYAMCAQRYLFEHQATEEDLARVAVTLRANAVDNPLAEHRKPITVADVLASRPVSPPLKRLDCSTFSSGAAAVVVTAEPLSRRSKGPPVAVTGIGEHHVPAHFGDRRASWTRFESAESAARQAFSEAGRTPGDVDLAELYGVFTATELILYEDLGFFPKGEAARAVREGLTSGRGRTMMNPSGGRLSLGHPAGATPLYAAVEVVQQLRGACGPRQVAGAKVGLVHAEHGMLDGSFVAILEGA